MELLLQLEEEKPVRELVVDHDPSQFPCGFLAQLFYSLLAEAKEAG
jgi:hypothetical protein